MARRVCVDNLQPVGIIAGVSSGVQGLVGAVLSICAICTYFCAFGSYVDTQSEGRFTFYHYLTFLFQGNKCDSNFKNKLSAADSVTGPQTIVIWMFLSLFFNVLLHVISVCLVIALWKWKKEKTVYVVNVWTFFSILTIIDDILLTYIFGNIYYSYSMVATPFQAFTTLLVAFFSSRGEILLLANMGLTVFMALASTDLMNDKKKAKKQESSRLEIIQGWPSLNNIQNGPSLNDRIERTSNISKGLNSGLPERRPYVRTPSMYGSQFPEYSALARWPSLAFNPTSQTMKERSYSNFIRPEVEQQRTSRSLRSYAMTNSNFPPPLPIQYVTRNRSSPDGNDNLAFEGSRELRDRFIRLRSDSGSEPYDPDIPPYPQEMYSSQTQPPNKSNLYNSDIGIESFPVKESKFETNTMRPNSLHEAILTRPPLKPVFARQRKNSSSNV